jgi:hypothetical protein
MIDIETEADKVVKASKKVEKTLSVLEPPTALAVINFTFMKMILESDPGPVAAKAMAATFMHNVLNSIHEFYHGDDEEESVH